MKSLFISISCIMMFISIGVITANAQSGSSQSKLIYNTFYPLTDTATGNTVNHEIKVLINNDGLYYFQLMDVNVPDSAISTLQLSQMNYGKINNWLQNNIKPDDASEKTKVADLTGLLIINTAINKLNIDEDRPLAGEFTFKDQLKVTFRDNDKKESPVKKDSVNKAPDAKDSISNKQTTTAHDSLLTVEDIVFEFDEGFITTIKVTGKLLGEEIMFINKYPIGFSTIRDYNNMSQTDLFAVQEEGIKSIKLADLIARYNPEIYHQQREYNPGNGVVAWTKEDGKKLKVYHDKSTELFKAKVFSDFVGLDEAKPNGLVQIEVSKRFNLWTKRHGVGKEDGSNTGFLACIEPYAAITKIEENNKFIPLQEKYSIQNGVLVKKSYISRLDLMQFQNLRTGLDQNIFLWDIPTLKSTFLINFGINLIRTGVIDSAKILDHNNVVNTNVVDKFQVTSVSFYPEFCWQIFTDARMSAFASYRLSKLFMYSDKVMAVSNIKKFEQGDEEEKIGWISSFNFTLTFKPNAMTTEKQGTKTNNPDKNELFFRFGYNQMNSEIKRNYFQAQVGYSFFIFKKNN
ncbi:MAG: hypothetical protein ABI723_15520 [Bacteroidia bacterium]